MKILVVSDTHGRWARLSDVLAVQRSAELVIHLGDGADDLDNVRYEYPAKMMIGVSGNCDYAVNLDALGEITVEGKHIFYTHGHIYNVKYGYEQIEEAARRRGADICLFGHTHEPFSDYNNGLYMLNPGSLGRPNDGQPTYGLIEITSAGIMTNIVKASY